MRRVVLVAARGCLFVSLVALLGVAACGWQGQPTGGSGTPTASARTGLSDQGSEPTPGMPATIAAQEAWSVTLARSGGLIGRTETTLIAPDGSVTVGPTSRRHPGGAAAAADLRARLEATGVHRLPPGTYLPARPEPDRFTYVLTLVIGSQRYEYATSEDAANVPALSDAIRLIQEYAAAAR